MSVHGLLITANTEQSLSDFYQRVNDKLNYIDRRGRTCRYTCMGEDMEFALQQARLMGLTAQEIIGAGDNEFYHLRHQGEADAWEPDDKSRIVNEEPYERH